MLLALMLLLVLPYRGLLRRPLLLLPRLLCRALAALCELRYRTQLHREPLLRPALTLLSSLLGMLLLLEREC